ncbi:MAG: cobalamin biosynthesis protein CobD [Firmicutes bacterium]|nr:cobalamin biosynthesis protein CobD [Bacillota bacterium]
MTLSLLPAALGYLVDRFAGDPPFLRHPVAVIGTLAGRLEKAAFGLSLLRSAPAWRRPAGAVLTAGVVAGTFLAVRFLLALAALVNPFLAAALEIWLISTTIASRGLAEASLSVAGALEAGDLPAGRRAVAGLVGRDTDRMDEAAAARASVESAAENTVDAVVAPLFYAAIGGAPLAMAYRAVNTLDSMWGYRNERYLRFGWAAARLDDLTGYVPARLAGVLMAGAAALLGLDWRGGIRTWRRDARKHPSPNAGIPEAVAAGALRIRLGGEASYGGRLEFRPYLDGSSARPLPAETPRLGPADIRRAVNLERWTGNLAALASLGGWIILRTW